MAFIIYIFFMNGQSMQQLSLIPIFTMSLLVLGQDRWRKVFLMQTGFYFAVITLMSYYACGGLLWPFIPAVNASCDSNVPVNLSGTVSALTHKDNVTTVVIVGNAARWVINTHKTIICRNERNTYDAFPPLLYVKLQSGLT